MFFVWFCVTFLMAANLQLGSDQVNWSTLEWNIASVSLNKSQHVKKCVLNGWSKRNLTICNYKQLVVCLNYL